MRTEVVEFVHWLYHFVTGPRLLALGGFVHLWIVWRWLHIDPVEVKRFLYELVTSPNIDNPTLRSADLRKVGFLVLLFLIVFLFLIQVLVPSPGTKIDNAQLALILSACLAFVGLGIYATNIKASVLTALAPKPPQKTEVSGPDGGPIPVTETPAAGDGSTPSYG